MQLKLHVEGLQKNLIGKISFFQSMSLSAIFPPTDAAYLKLQIKDNCQLLSQTKQR